MVYQIKRWSLFLLLIGLCGIFFYFRLYRFLSFASLKAHRLILLQWIEYNYFVGMFAFMAIYIVVVAILSPGPVFLTLTAGLLFGPLIGTILVVISATIGAFIIFLAVNLALRAWFAKISGRWLKIMERGLQKNAFTYLIFLRLVPLFPFWIVNIVPALLDIPRRTFFIATFIGIIPGTLVYVMIGRGLGEFFAAHTHISVNIATICEPQIIWPLLAWVLLALLPIGYKYWPRLSTLITVEKQTAKRRVKKVPREKHPI